jgi:hypothetical protein
VTTWPSQGRGLNHAERRAAWRLRSLGDDVLKSVRVDRFGGDNDIDGFAQPLDLAAFSLQVAEELLPHVLARNPRPMIDLVFGEHLPRRIDVDLDALERVARVEGSVQKSQEFLDLLRTVEDRGEPYRGEIGKLERSPVCE